MLRTADWHRYRGDEAVPAANDADDPLRRYEVSPIAASGADQAVSRAGEGGRRQRQCRGRLSLTSAQRCRAVAHRSRAGVRGLSVLIAGPVEVDAPLDMRAYRLRNGHFEAVELIVDERPEAATPRATTP